MIPSKRLRNKIAGYTTHLMKRINSGPVRGISLRLQEEERERRENVIPDHSIMEDLTASIVIDAETKELLGSMGLDRLEGVTVASAADAHHHHGRDHGRTGHRERRHRDRGDADLPGGKRREGRRAAAGGPATLPAEAIEAEAAATAAAATAGSQ